MRSVELVTTVNADYNGSFKTLVVGFYEDFGNVIISVENSRGEVVYSDCVYARSYSQSVISMRGLASGDYSITLTPVGEDPMEGDFYVY